MWLCAGAVDKVTVGLGDKPFGVAHCQCVARRPLASPATVGHKALLCEQPWKVRHRSAERPVRDEADLQAVTEQQMILSFSVANKVAHDANGAKLKGTAQFFNVFLNWDSHLVESTRAYQHAYYQRRPPTENNNNFLNEIRAYVGLRGSSLRETVTKMKILCAILRIWLWILLYCYHSLKEGHQLICKNVLPVRRHVWRCTSEPERDKSVFGVVSMSRLSGFRDNETGNARANVQSPHLRLLSIS